MDLAERISARTARICVVGLGYVGLPLAVEFAEAGYQVWGVDVNPAKIAQLRDGESYIGDVSTARVAALVAAERLFATTDVQSVHLPLDAFFICVPTPYTALKVPDLRFITAAAESIAAVLRPGQLVVLESTTYPGTTEELVLPLLEQGSGLRHDRDFYIAFSPERIDPGRKRMGDAPVPKVVGGSTGAVALAAALLDAVAPGAVHTVSSPRVAEMAKLLENTFRSVNIALVNELALLCERMRIDLWEVIAAASTKPFGFMPFYPGPGVGGHCIPVDPFYLSWKARGFDFYTRFVELAAEINDNMPFHAADLVDLALDSRCRSTRGARILVVGVAFKRDVDDARNSPAQRVIEVLLDRGAHVAFHDPYIPTFTVARAAFSTETTVLRSVPLNEDTVSAADAVVLLQAHRCIDLSLLTEHASLLIDTTGATRCSPRKDIWLLGAPHPVCAASHPQ